MRFCIIHCIINHKLKAPKLAILLFHYAVVSLGNLWLLLLLILYSYPREKILAFKQALGDRTQEVTSKLSDYSRSNALMTDITPSISLWQKNTHYTLWDEEHLGSELMTYRLIWGSYNYPHVDVANRSPGHSICPAKQWEHSLYDMDTAKYSPGSRAHDPSSNTSFQKYRKPNYMAAGEA